MAQIPGSQLRWVQKVFGLAGQQLSGATNLDDGDVTQVLEVGQLARRGENPALDQLFYGVLENVHGAADSETSNIQPYTPGASATPPFPDPVPEEFDLWLYGVSGVRSSGAGGLVGALLSFNPFAQLQGWGDDDQGAPVIASPFITVARFDSVSDGVVANRDPMLTEAGDPYIALNMRLPRNLTLVFDSESAAAAEFQMVLWMGIFPVGLGQDGLT